MTIRCEQCAYWDNRHEEERAQGRSGFCCRDTPHPEFGWALTDAADWCGHAVPRDAGGAMAVVTEAQKLVEALDKSRSAIREVIREEVDALRDALESMKP